jgi:hypothetical protein
MGIEDVFEGVAEAVDKVQEGIDVGRAAPTRCAIGPCNWLMMIAGVGATAILIVPPLLATASGKKWLRGKTQFPWAALTIGWIVTGGLIAILVIGVPLQAASEGFGEEGLFGLGWNGPWVLPLFVVIMMVVATPFALLLRAGVKRVLLERKGSKGPGL